MKVSINGITLNATAYAERDMVTGIITCTVIVPQSEMDYADLKALFKDNTEDISYTKDDESTELFSGFTYSSILDDDTNGQYIVKLTADEYSFQLGRNRQLEADKANLETTVASKNNEISNLNSFIVERDKDIADKENVITEQAEIISTLEATLTARDVEIEELLAIAEEYADVLFAEATAEESEVE